MFVVLKWRGSVGYEGRLREASSYYELKLKFDYQVYSKGYLLHMFSHEQRKEKYRSLNISGPPLSLFTKATFKSNDARADELVSHHCPLEVPP